MVFLKRPSPSATNDTSKVPRMMSPLATSSPCTSRARSPPSTAAASSSSQRSNESMKFEELMAECGVNLSNSIDQPSKLSGDPSVVVQMLVAAYEKATYKDSFVDALIDGLERYVRTPVFLQAVVTPTTYVPAEVDGSDSMMPSSSDSVARILLKVDAFQDRVASLLVGKMASMMEKRGGTRGGVDLPRLILDQFRYLDSVHDSEGMCIRFLDILPLCDAPMKADILSCLPQFVDGSQQLEIIANRLKRLMKEDKSVFGLALEAIGNFPLTSEAMTLLQTHILTEFDGFTIFEKLATFQFLLQTAELAMDIDKLFLDMRNLDFGDLSLGVGKPGRSQTNPEALIKMNVNTVALCVASALERSLKRNKTLSDSAYRVENSLCNKGEEDNFFDAVTTMVLFSTKRNRQICTLVRQKLQKKCWKVELLDECFQHREVMMLCVRSFMGVSDYLLRLPEKRLSVFGANLYQRLFFVVDGMHRQEIVATLVSHVASGKEQEVDVAIDALRELSESIEIVEYGMTLQGLLDLVANLKLNQVRKVFAIFGKLATFENDDSVASLDDLHIFVRKIMNCGPLRLKAVGILASVTLYRQLSSQKGMKDQAIALHKLADVGSVGDPTLRALFYDDLSNAIRNGDLKTNDFLVDLKDGLFQILEGNFIAKLDKESWNRMAGNGMLLGVSQTKEPSIALKFSLDNVAAAEHSQFVEKSQPMEKCRSNKRNADESPAVLPSLLRLFLLCEWNLCGHLDDVDELLVCPFVIRFRKNWTRMGNLLSTDQEQTCMELVHCGNSLIELINGLSLTDLNAGGCKSMLDRMKDLVLLRREFEDCAQSALTFALPGGDLFQSESDGRQKSNKKRQIVRKPANKNVGSQAVTCSSLISQVVASCASAAEKSMLAENADEAGPSHKRETITQNSNRKSDNISRCFRSLDVPVFSILKCPLVCRESDGDGQSASLTPATLAYVLSDLVEKIRYLSLMSQDKPVANFLAAKNGKSYSELLDASCLELLKERMQIIAPEVWKHMMSCLEYFKSLAEENDGVVDSLGIRGPESITIAKCVELSTDCLSTYFTWLDNNETLSTMRKVLASFFPDQSTGSQQSSVDSYNLIANGLFQFTDYVPSLGMADGLLRLARKAAKFGQSKENELKIGEIANQYLKREWDSEDAESTATNKTVANLIEMSLTSDTAKECLAKIEGRTSDVSVFLRQGPGTDVEYKSITKTTLSTWYRTLFTRLAAVAKDSPRMKTDADNEAWVEHWTAVARTFRLIAVAAAKPDSPRPILAAALFRSGAVVQLFTTSVVPILEKVFLTVCPKTVKQLFTVVQNGTRALHDICVDSKIKQDRYLMKFLPTLKRILESFVFRVKAMMAVNNCSDALTIGVLKNKNLKGETISSQASSRSEADEAPEGSDAGDHENEEEAEYQEDQHDDEMPDDEENEETGNALGSDRNECESIDSDDRSVAY